MITTVINLIGSPGTGKSTIASELFAKMKWQGFDVELVSKYAKELVWEQRQETFKNELYIFAKQQHRLFRLNGKVDYIITDRPLILSVFYNNKYGNGSENFKNIVFKEIEKFNNIDIFLNRTKPYVTKGRNETEEQSKAFADEILKLVKDYNKDCVVLDAVADKTSDEIINILNDCGGETEDEEEEYYVQFIGKLGRFQNVDEPYNPFNVSTLSSYHSNKNKPFENREGERYDEFFPFINETVVL